jgi:hypothetical protein
MAKKPPVPMTTAQTKLEAKIFGLLQKKRYADARAAVKELTKNSTGRKILRGVFGSALWLSRSKALWVIALGAAGFKYGPELWDKLTDTETTEDQMDEYISDLGENIPDRNFVTEIPRGAGALEGEPLSERQMERAGEKLQREVTEGEEAQAKGLLYSPEVREARSRERQMLPSGTFDRGWQQQRFVPSGSLFTTTTTPGLEEGLRRNRLWPAIGDKYTGGQYTPSAGGTGSAIDQVTEAQRQELEYPPFSPGQPFELIEERRFQPDRRIGPRPQPVETPWDQAAKQAKVYGPDDRQAALASLQAQQQLGEEVETGQLPPLLQRPSPHEGLQPIIAPPSAPPTGPEIEYPREVKRYESMPTAEEAASGAFDFLPLEDGEIQSISETGEITDDEGTLQDMAERLTGEERLTAGATSIYKAGEWAVGLGGKAAEIVGDVVGQVFSGGDVKEEDVKNQIYVDLDTGRVITEGEDPAQVKGVASESAKEEGKALNQKAQDQANVARVAQNYGLNPAIKDTLSQIERNASILRATSVMMGVKDISSNYRDMSIGQLRLARDIVEDLNEGTKGPWIEWNLPDGTKVHLPRTGANSKPPEGASQTDPNIPRYQKTAEIKEVKDLIRAGQPWDAYRRIIQLEMGAGIGDTHTIAQDMMTMFWREVYPDLPLGYKWPRWPDYEAWQLRRDAGPEQADSDFMNQHGGYLPVLR